MSWQRGQGFGTGARQPFVNMAAVMGTAAFAAAGVMTNRAMIEAQMKDFLRQVEALPQDIDGVAFMAGVMRYMAIEQELGPRPVREAYPELIRVGRVCLRDAGGVGAPVVLVPSMVNRGYVLDLLPGHSLVEHLREAGRRVLVVDWGEPVAGEILTLEQAVVLLEALLKGAVGQVGPLALVGYCMGGLLALAAAVRLGKGVVSRLALAAVPWDFGVTASAGHFKQARPVLEPWLQQQAVGLNVGLDVIGPEVLAHYFWVLDPWGPIRRLMAFGREQDRERLVFLTALEDWLADGMALDGPVAREMMRDWYDENRPMLGRWEVGGVVIGPRALEVPLWVAVSQRDVLVPPLSALGVVAQARNPSVVMVDSGHVGLVCGRQAKKLFYSPLVGWLAAC